MSTRDYILIGIAFACLAAAIAMRIAAGLEVPVWLVQRAIVPFVFVCGVAWIAGRVMARWGQESAE